MSFAVRPMVPADTAGAVALQRVCFPPPFPEKHLWTEAHLLAHLARFAEGQFVAVADAQVVGSASAAIVKEEAWDARRSWDETLGGWELSAHDPEGTTLYGADISVHPAYRQRGVGRALYAVRFDLVRRLGLRRFGTACRIPGFAASGLASPALYVEAVAAGERADRTLTPLLRYGLRVVACIEGFMHDAESGDAAALLEWTP
jgi:GNAT superfamily N-acetyltransferase